MMGRKKIEIDIAEVERLAGEGLTHEEIALSLAISPVTLYARKNESEEFEQAIKRGKAKAKHEIANALFDKARGGDLGAIIWYEKTRSGFSDKVDSHNYNMEVELSSLTDDQLARLERGESVYSVLRSA